MLFDKIQFRSPLPEDISKSSSHSETAFETHFMHFQNIQHIVLMLHVKLKISVPLSFGFELPEVETDLFRIFVFYSPNSAPST